MHVSCDFGFNVFPNSEKNIFTSVAELLCILTQFYKYWPSWRHPQNSPGSLKYLGTNGRAIVKGFYINFGKQINLNVEALKMLYTRKKGTSAESNTTLSLIHQHIPIWVSNILLGHNYLKVGGCRFFSPQNKGAQTRWKLVKRQKAKGQVSLQR